MMDAALKLAARGRGLSTSSPTTTRCTSIHDGETLREITCATRHRLPRLRPRSGEVRVLSSQSDVPEVAELSWILSTVTPMGLLGALPLLQGQDRDAAFPPRHALFAYPVLMAADILLYDSDVVPVGRDQKQHVEVTRDIAIKMNEAFGRLASSKSPEPRIRDETAVVPGLDGQKMSKSYGNTIELFEEPAALKKIMGIPTDSHARSSHPSQPKAPPSWRLYKLVASSADHDAMVADYQRGGVGYGRIEQAPARRSHDVFCPDAREARRDRGRSASCGPRAGRGRRQARIVARKTLGRIREAVGL